MLTTSTQVHILPYKFVYHPLMERVFAYTNTTPSRIMPVERDTAERELLREDLDVHRRLFYEKVVEKYEENE